MANIVVVSTTNCIKVDFGSYYPTSAIYSKAIWQKDMVRFALNTNFVEVIVMNETGFAITFDGATGSLQVDTVDGVAPVSNSDLYDKLIALLG